MAQPLAVTLPLAEAIDDDDVGALLHRLGDALAGVLQPREIEPAARCGGIEVLRQLKAHPTLRKLPVIILTTTDEPQEIERCHALSCNVYIRKPVAFPNFIDAMERLGHFLPLIEYPRLVGEPR